MTNIPTLPSPILDALACFSSAASNRDREDRPVLLRQAFDDVEAAINAHVEAKVRSAVEYCSRWRELDNTGDRLAHIDAVVSRVMAQS